MFTSEQICDLPDFDEEQFIFLNAYRNALGEKWKDIAHIKPENMPGPRWRTIRHDMKKRTVIQIDDEFEDGIKVHSVIGIYSKPNDLTREESLRKGGRELAGEIMYHLANGNLVGVQAWPVTMGCDWLWRADIVLQGDA